jgi:hypothetical protein
MPKEDWMRFVIVLFGILMLTVLLMEFSPRKNREKMEDKIIRILREELGRDAEDNSEDR